MAVFVLKDSRIAFHSVDLSAQANQLRLNYAADVLDVTTFGSGGARKRIAGLLVPSADYRGYWDLAANLDLVINEAIGPVAEDDDHVLIEVAMKATAYTLDQTTMPAAGPATRHLILTHRTVTTVDTLGSAVVVGTDANSVAISETIALVANSTVRTLKDFLTITSITTAGWVISGTADQLKVGVSGNFARPLSVAPTDDVGDRAFLTEVLKATLRRGGSVGEAASLEGTFEPAARRLVKGYLFAVGEYGTADNNWWLESVNMQATAYTQTNTALPTDEAARIVSITHTTVDVTDTLGNMVIIGTDANGAALTETVALSAGATVLSVAEFKTISSLRTATWVQGGGTPDTIIVGYPLTTKPINMGAVTASQFLYGALHVFPTVDGTNPTLDVVVQSDTAQAFPSATTQMTFATKTAVGSQFAAPVAGAITDTWWRLSITVGGTSTPQFPILVVLGVAA